MRLLYTALVVIALFGWDSHFNHGAWFGWIGTHVADAMHALVAPA